jgi:probable addiction module antidote protein/putative addiction module killer protein
VIEVRQTEAFSAWLRKLRDLQALARIQIRIRRLSLGNFGDAKSVGEGVSELRIDYGPGYRVYFQKTGNLLLLLPSEEPRRHKTQILPKRRSSPRRLRMALKTTVWDPSEFLDSPESIAAYLEAAFEDGDPSLIAAALGDIARAIGMTQMATQAGVTREALYKALSPNGDPRLSTFLGVMKALGIKLTPRAA